MNIVYQLQVCRLKKNVKYIPFGESIKFQKMGEYLHFQSWNG